MERTRSSGSTKVYLNVTKKLFHAAMVISGGRSYAQELRGGLLQGIFGQVATILPTYAQNELVPLLTAHETTPSLTWFDPTAQPRLERLMDISPGDVSLTPAIETALSALPADEPALITVISNFLITDPAELVNFVDRMANRYPLAFLKLIFATSGAHGNNSLPYLLEERHQGSYSTVDAIFATHFLGQPGESVSECFGRKLDVLAQLLMSHSR